MPVLVACVIVCVVHAGTVELGVPANASPHAIPKLRVVHGLLRRSDRFADGRTHSRVVVWANRRDRITSACNHWILSVKLSEEVHARAAAVDPVTFLIFAPFGR